MDPQVAEVIAQHQGDADIGVMVVGGGVGGMRAAIDLAEAGLRVVLVESMPSLGGRVAQLGFMFPTHDCVLCRGTSDHGYGCTRPAISPAFMDHNLHPNIEVLTNAQIVAAEGQAGNFTVRVRQYPRHVDVDRCTNCGLCAIVCPVTLPSGFQMGLSQRKAIYKPAPRAIPDAYVLDKGPYCEDCGLCVDVCPTQAIDLDQGTVEREFHVGAVILAIGYSLTDLSLYEEYGWGRYANVLHSMQYERLASRSGPTEGIVVRPSDGEMPRRIAWLQCVGSRDQRYPYCSSICCMYATKEAILARQRLPDVECTIFMMDERAFNKEFNAYYERSREEYDVRYVRCRISAVKEDPETKDLWVRYVRPDGQVVEERFNMVVLSVGTQPPALAKVTAEVLGIDLNPYGFCETDKFTPLQTSQPGIYVCGTFQSPKEIAETIIDAAGAAGDVMRLMRADLGKAESSREYPFISDNGFGEERDVLGEAPRIGVFVCDCHPSIDSVVDTEALIRYAETLPDVVHAERIDYACFCEGRGRIQSAIQRHRLNRVVVAGCSHRTHESLFQRVVREVGLNPYLLEMVNIREHCAWVHSAYPEKATRKAMELLRGGIGRVRLMTPIYKQSLNPARRALVIGGGVAGMTAALSIADSGYDVVLVERSAELGGNLRHVYYVAEGQNPQRLLRDLVNRVRGHERITVFTRSEVVEHTGSVGRFHSVIRTRPEGRGANGSGPEIETHVDHGVTIVATGGEEWRGDVYLLGKSEQVITEIELEDRIAHRPETVAGLNHIVMIQCVRSPDMPDYCSRICCTNSMKNAIRIKLLNPDCQVTILYKDIITYGFREQYYTEARRRGVIFIRYDDETRPVVEQVDGRIRVRVQEPVLQRELSFTPDLLVLNMAIVPSKGTTELARTLGVPLSREGFFMEAHLKMRPMDFMQEGVFVAGMAHYPKFIEEAIAHAQAVAGRAITILSKQPLYIGGNVAVVDQNKCVGCLTCVRTCPFGIPKIRPDLTGVGGIAGAAYIDPALCHGCGTCTGECPAKAIQLVAYTDEQILAQGVGAWERIEISNP
ncbi:MAG TPA: CoB--CoM heterodisulfide reductase iron-sulfur subunit A family protein [Caldilineae bacterium]|nr:CoB--CoM heterodisulfide reductase iron-sulfur subunit A family protein [Caldilineae bacterium]